jgi:hypothetical protein
MQDFSDSHLRSIDPNMIYLWDWIPARGKSGGVLFGVKIDRFDVGQRRQGEFILLHHVWDKKLEIKWNILNVYGAAEDEHKDDFELSWLFSILAKRNLILWRGGDFNILRFSSDKNKKFVSNRFSNTFNAIINVNDLRDLELSWGRYTWSNNHYNPTLKKLDRVLVSRDWENFFSHGSYSY